MNTSNEEVPLLISVAGDDHDRGQQRSRMSFLTSISGAKTALVGFLGVLVLFCVIGMLVIQNDKNGQTNVLQKEIQQRSLVRPHSLIRRNDSLETKSKMKSNNNAELIINEDPAVTRFREYLRLKAVQPNPDYRSSIAWIKRQCDEIGLEFNQLKVGQETVVWGTWRGKDQNLPSILLNSHMDVVPVDTLRWTHDPFAAEKDPKTGNIYDRGAQDMKSVGCQYLEAIRNLKQKGLIPLRNVHVSFVPDEENGGTLGMVPFVKMQAFKNLNVGFALDEGIPSPVDEFLLVYAERAIWQVLFKAEGKSGHASILHENTAAEKIQKVINLMLDLRTKEKERMEKERLEMGDVTSINLTTMKGGQQPNVVPAELTVGFDIRITPSWSFDLVQKILDNITLEAGPQVTYSFIHKSDVLAQTPLTKDNFWWTTFQNAAKEFGFSLKPAIHPGGTDIRYVRQLGIPAFGFSPINHTPTLAHDHDEFLNENIFLNGVKVYEEVLPKIFNLKNP